MRRSLLFQFRIVFFTFSTIDHRHRHVWFVIRWLWHRSCAIIDDLHKFLGEFVEPKQALIRYSCMHKKVVDVDLNRQRMIMKLRAIDLDKSDVLKVQWATKLIRKLKVHWSDEFSKTRFLELKRHLMKFLKSKLENKIVNDKASDLFSISKLDRRWSCDVFVRNLKRSLKNNFLRFLESSQLKSYAKLWKEINEVRENFTGTLNGG